MKIPKIIHYVWVGPKPLTPLAKRCIESWEKYLPDYEIRFWNEENSPMESEYVKEMYKKKKWAFVADYIRFWALAREGGVYLDTDTEVIKSFDDLLGDDVFFGKTKDGITAAGVIGATPNHKCIKDILDVYDTDDRFDTTRTSPDTVTRILKENEYQDVVVYGYEYFNPCDDGENCTAEKLKKAYTINHWAESWVAFSRIRKLMRRLGLMSYVKYLRKLIYV